MQGISEIKCVGEKRLKTERLERGKGKKRGNDAENGVDQKKKEDIGQKLELRVICIP